LNFRNFDGPKLLMVKRRIRMRFKLALVLGIGAIGVMVLALPAWSHHSHSNYAKETKDFEGIVTQIHLLNPHSWIYMNVTDASGKTQIWALEGGGRNGLAQLAKEGKGLKIGDKIKVRCHPLRDGGAGCLFGFVKHPDGTIRDYDSGGREVRIEGL
jgi:hypothetical protein